KTEVFSLIGRLLAFSNMYSQPALLPSGGGEKSLIRESCLKKGCNTLELIPGRTFLFIVAGEKGEP
ncbi:MAG: hypothetical protein WCD00_10500, partial [Desulfuromonadaceae bacterium]